MKSTSKFSLLFKNTILFIQFFLSKGKIEAVGQDAVLGGHIPRLGCHGKRCCWHGPSPHGHDWTVNFLTPYVFKFYEKVQNQPSYVFLQSLMLF